MIIEYTLIVATCILAPFALYEGWKSHKEDIRRQIELRDSIAENSALTEAFLKEMLTSLDIHQLQSMPENELQAPPQPFTTPVRSREQDARWKAYCASVILS
jgi:hypothetical protein